MPAGRGHVLDVASISGHDNETCMEVGKSKLGPSHAARRADHDDDRALDAARAHIEPSGHRERG
jgi:hypothetical protein